MRAPRMMRAIGHPGPRPIEAEDALVEFEAPVPQPGPEQLLVEVLAVAVNPIDVKLRSSGKASPHAPRILGFEAAGRVVEVGSNVRRFTEGDMIYYLGRVDRPGSFAACTLVDQAMAAIMPRTLSAADAAALPLTGLTAYELLFERMGIRPDMDGTLLVINGAGGVGSIAIQLARRLTRLHVIATASRPQSQDWCRAMGAHDVVSHDRPLSQEIQKLGIDAVDFVAALSQTDHHLPEIVRSTKPFGMIGVIDQPRALDVMSLREKALGLVFEGVFVRSLKQCHPGRQGEILAEISALVDKGEIKSTRAGPIRDFDLSSAIASHRLMESGRSIGKTILKLAP